MTLSASSVLHYWDARYGSIPVIGGAPTFSRNSAGSWVDQTGTLQSAIVNTPRTEWAPLYGEDPTSPATLGKRRPVLRLEMARTNNLLYSSDFSNAAWTKTNITVTTGIADPAGGISACTLTATSATNSAEQLLAAGASLARAGSLWIRRRTGTGTVQMITPDGVTWTTVAVTTTWARYTVIGSANTVRDAAVRLLTSGDAIDVYNYQLDDSAFATSDIVTPAAAPVTRATDTMSYFYAPAPVAAVCYARMEERGTALSGARVFTIASDADAAAECVLYASGGSYRGYHQVGATVSAVTLAAAPALSDTVELCLVLNTDGHVDIHQSLNGAAVTTATDATAPGFASAWSGQKLHINSVATTAVGCNRFASFKIVKLADVVASTPQGIMDELRSFALDSRQGVL